MVNQDLVNKLKGWAENPPTPENVDANFGVEYFTTLFSIFKELSLEDEDLREEVEDADFCMQYVMTNEGQEFKFWIACRDEKLDFGMGEGTDVSVTMTASAENIFAMFSGQADSTALYMSGDLTIDGNLQDAMAFGEIASIAAELLEDLMG